MGDTNNCFAIVAMRLARMGSCILESTANVKPLIIVMMGRTFVSMVPNATTIILSLESLVLVMENMKVHIANLGKMLTQKLHKVLARILWRMLPATLSQNAI